MELFGFPGETNFIFSTNIARKLVIEFITL